MDGIVPRPSVPSSPVEEGMSAGDGLGQQKYCHRPSSTVTGRLRVVTINTYTVTVEHASGELGPRRKRKRSDRAAIHLGLE